jgi:GT2 family glycosyltransferase
MNSLASAELFDANYYATSCGRKYERNDWWLTFFGAIADRIVQEIAPKTVLDAGCALGFLVEELRNRGVAAYGVDISSYAIAHVDPSIRPYCWAGSVTEPFPQRYDLIVCIEVLEHMMDDESRAAIENLCRHSDNVLFSSTPSDTEEVTHFNVQPQEYWAEQFALHGFFRDVDFDASFVTAWAAYYRRRDEPVPRLIRDFERRYWLLQNESQDLRKENQDLRNLALETQLARDDALERVARLNDELGECERRWDDLQASPGMALVRRLQRLRARVAPPLSSRDQVLNAMWHGARGHSRRAMREASQRIGYEISQQAGSFYHGAKTVARPQSKRRMLDVPEVPAAISPTRRTAPVDIVICIHNALEDVERCLQSVVAHTAQPYSLTLVDDGSDAATHKRLAAFADEHGATLLHNEAAAGYTRAANRGLAAASADLMLLLNSDTVVSPGYLDRLVACAMSDPRIGIAGPLSNAATWQSIPQVQDGADWSINALPDGCTVAEFGETVARHSAQIYPPMPFLNGFCLLIKRALVQQIGVFDEEDFGAGYGEENDYCLRARAAGWQLALADDAYVYHAGSRSYSDERRRSLCQRADAVLAAKHGPALIQAGVQHLARDRVLEGMRAHGRVLAEQRKLLLDGSERFAGRKLLWVLPVATSGGGGSVVVLKSRLMREMGVEVAIFNRQEFRETFDAAYPWLNIPVLYGKPEDLPEVAHDFDAVVATVNTTVPWLIPLAQANHPVRTGYFIQDFEAYFYPPDSPEFQRARSSYTMIPEMLRFTTTHWIQEEVIRNTGMSCGLVGPCFDLDLFRPRPRPGPEWPDRPLRIAAMIRPETPYRSPRMTMEILRNVANAYGRRVEIRLFGTRHDDPGFLALPRDFRWRLGGRLNQRQVAALLNEVDIFVDFSEYQALGITAQEAMASGAAAIAPLAGGAGEWARQEQNCLLVDTSSAQACEQALRRLMNEHDLRLRLQKNGIADVCAFYPERPAYNILNALFGSP